MKLFKTQQVKEIDAQTITEEGISSFDLMRRAVRALFERLLPDMERDRTVCVVAGPGNNGGDALLLADMLHRIGQPLRVYLLNPSCRLSADCQMSLEVLRTDGVSVTMLIEAVDFRVEADEWVVDGLLGSGLNRPLEGLYAEVVRKINDSGAKVFSIDIPSGLFGEDNIGNNPDTIIRATRTYTFQFPKISFLAPENQSYVGEWSVVDIQLSRRAMREMDSSWFLTEESDMSGMCRPRPKFSHKGTFGHALLIAGSYGMMGAAVLGARAAMRTGCGLLTAHIPARGVDIMQISVPEAIVSMDEDERCFSALPDLGRYKAVAVGPGIGQGETAGRGVKALLERVNVPLVMDADALNILSKHQEWMDLLPSGTILTPHPKEFERLVGKCASQYERWERQCRLSVERGVVVVLKGAYTSVSLPDGTLHINQTGNPGMATAGSGDVLTGMILSLLAQGYAPSDAARLGVWLHGLAGDCALTDQSEESLLASDIIHHIGDACLRLKSSCHHATLP